MRGILFLLLLVLVVGGALWFLSGQAGEVPVETIEEPVELGGDAEE